MNIKVISFYEDHWMPPGTDLAQWDHLCRAYGADLQMIRDWSEAVVPEGYAVILLDENGPIDLSTPADVIAAAQQSQAGALPENMVLVFGRTAQDLLTTVPDYYGAFRIMTPNEVSMFGVNAAAIALFTLDQLQRGVLG